jgi:hypothetical protein
MHQTLKSTPYHSHAPDIKKLHSNFESCQSKLNSLKIILPPARFNCRSNSTRPIFRKVLIQYQIWLVNSKFKLKPSLTPASVLPCPQRPRMYPINPTLPPVSQQPDIATYLPAIGDPACRPAKTTEARPIPSVTIPARAPWRRGRCRRPSPPPQLPRRPGMDSPRHPHLPS